MVLENVRLAAQSRSPQTWRRLRRADSLVQARTRAERALELQAA